MAWASHSFDEYLSFIRKAGYNTVMVAKPSKEWRIDEITAGDVTLRWGRNGGALAVEGARRRSHFTISVPLCNTRESKGNGIGFDANSLMLWPPGSEFCLSSVGWNDWMSVDIPHTGQTPYRHGKMLYVGAGMQASVVSITSRIIAAIQRADTLRDEAGFAVAALADLQRVVHEAMHANADTPPGTVRHGPERISRTKLAATVRSMSADDTVGRVSVDDLAREADVSPRTLQNAFHEFYSASVHRFLHLRSLQHVHRVLSRANPEETSVTRVAMGFGFWDLGRFAQQYRRLYGERPSDTLRRPAHKVRWNATSANGGC